MGWVQDALDIPTSSGGGGGGSGSDMDTNSNTNTGGIGSNNSTGVNSNDASASSSGSGSISGGGGEVVSKAALVEAILQRLTGTYSRVVFILGVCLLWWRCVSMVCCYLYLRGMYSGSAMFKQLLHAPDTHFKLS